MKINELYGMAWETAIKHTMSKIGLTSLADDWRAAEEYAAENNIEFDQNGNPILNNESTKSELIKKFNLRKLPTKAYFLDGNVEKNRALYTNSSGNYYVYYNGDLHIYKPIRFYNYYAIGRLCAGYSWYR